MDALKKILLIGIAFISFFSFGWSSSDHPKVVEKKETVVSICEEKEELVETDQEVVINGEKIEYRTITGNLFLKDESCQPKASFFFISYAKKGVEDLSERPITFCFNGGPGSSSVWLHLGVLGPKRVAFNDNGDALPPYHLIENEYSLLDVTDLVFIDPVSTGYSHAIPYSEAKQYHGVEEDIKSVAEFIRLYLTRFNRWESPKFIAGESYGTTRAAGLAGHLQEHHFININGIVLISSVLNFQSIDFSAGNDLSYLLFLPSYTATAWYHKKLNQELQDHELVTVLNKARDFVINEYAHALFKGDLLLPSEKEKIIQKLAFFTGLSPDYIERSHLRVEMMHFLKELLRNEKRTLGRFDSRFKGIDANAVKEYFDYDPSAEAIFGAFTATFNHYVHQNLKWPKDNEYKILTNVQPWNYGNENKYLNVSETLRSVMTKNPYLRVFVGNGFYDLATPFFATEYTFNHLGLDPSLLNHVTMKYYDAGHMMYIYRPALIQVKKDLANFYVKTLQNQEREEKEEKSIEP